MEDYEQRIYRPVLTVIDSRGEPRSIDLQAFGKSEIRIGRKEDDLFIEVEDTGGGMEPGLAEEILEKMKNGTIESLKSGEHVGITNACLRLNMLTKKRTEYHLESEEGIGTYLSIRIPVDLLSVEDVYEQTEGSSGR